MVKVSVVIPLYNKEPHIKRTLCSVLGQNVNDFEVIVVDGGSEDNGPTIVENFANMDSRIRLIRQEGTGVSEARNQGVRESRSDLIALLDADDEWMSNYLETILRMRDNYPYAGLYATSIKNEFIGNVLMELDEELRNLVPNEGLILSYFKIYKHGHALFGTSSVTIPKKIFLNIGGFQTDFWWGEDIDLWGRIALKYQIAYSSQVCAIYYQNVINSAVKRKKPVETHPFLITAKKALNLDQVPHEMVNDLKAYVMFLEMFTAKHNIEAGDKKLAFGLLIRKDINLTYKKRLLRTIVSTSVKTNFPLIYKKYLNIYNHEVP
ncbi:putative glycosyl transferase [Methanosarcina siciliae T4/M]|uniref:Putative glycosyl transferase n=1 Tax=Methanosarcina siciliae T4/M TaxID=1434120 RepID=A0A0E3P7F9_9EURY|nr:glycosyltransferase family A protein [Methanosarcina siciliae]AKB29742.1 putative glycosyl transferase [Methanosarcina siciliae T4/M]